MHQKVLSRAYISLNLLHKVYSMLTHMIDYETFTVGEAPFSYSADDLAAFVLPSSHELDMVFQFEHMALDEVPGQDPLLSAGWTLSDLKRVVEKWQTFKRDEGYWNTWVLH
jgi:oligo-1,6-glucosidase